MNPDLSHLLGYLAARNAKEWVKEKWKKDHKACNECGNWVSVPRRSLQICERCERFRRDSTVDK